jgi:hypothetical protein
MPRVLMASFLLAAATFSLALAAHAQAVDSDPWGTRAPQESRAMAARVRQHQAQLEARDAARYAENRRRCAAALRIAELCGRHAGTFYCDARGFQPIPQAQRAREIPLDNPARQLMDECARRAAQGGP